MKIAEEKKRRVRQPMQKYAADEQRVSKGKRKLELKMNINVHANDKPLCGPVGENITWVLVKKVR